MEELENEIPVRMAALGVEMWTQELLNTKQVHLRSQVFWDVTPCYWKSGSWHFREIMVAVIFKGQQCNTTAWYCTQMKRDELHNWRHSITSQKPRFLSSTATRTSNLAEAWYIWPLCFVLGSCCLKRLVLG
jgi:hypothetical protein